MPRMELFWIIRDIGGNRIYEISTNPDKYKDKEETEAHALWTREGREITKALLGTTQIKTLQPETRLLLKLLLLPREQRYKLIARFETLLTT